MDLKKRVPTLFASCEKLIWKFFPTRVGALGWPLPGFFFGIFLKKKLEGSVGQIMYREYIVFRGSNISCSLASNTLEVEDRLSLPAAFILRTLLRMRMHTSPFDRPRENAKHFAKDVMFV